MAASRKLDRPDSIAGMTEKQQTPGKVKNKEGTRWRETLREAGEKESKERAGRKRETRREGCGKGRTPTP